MNNSTYHHDGKNACHRDAAAADPYRQTLGVKIKHMPQIVRELSKDMIDRLEAQRDWVRNHYKTNACKLYETFDGKMDLIDTILKFKWIEKSETNKLQCLGVTLGDAIIQDLGFRWIEIEDEYGTDPALKLGDTSLVLFPLTMISKRIENNQEIDIYVLYNGIKDHVLKIKGKVDK